MKILHLIPYFYPAASLGGTAAVVYNIAKKQVEKGHQVCVYTTDLHDSGRRINNRTALRKTIFGVRVYYFRNLSCKLAYSFNFYLPLNFFSHLLKTINGFDIIHLHEIYTVMHLWTAFIARIKHIPYLISPQGTATLVNKTGRLFRKKIFNIIFGRFLYDNCAAFIVSSRIEKNSLTLLGIPENKVFLIPNGVDSALYRNIPDKFLSRKRLGLNKNNFVLLFLGRIHPKKGIDLIIDALPKVLSIFKNVILLIVGPMADKTYREYLNKKITLLKLHDKVKFMNSVSGKNKLAVFSASDIFILPSFQEGLPVGALEAAASNLPLVLTKDCGIGELEKSRAGLYISHDKKSIARAIIRILGDKIKSSYRQNARLMVKKYYSADKQIFNIMNLYKRIIRYG